ncbi:hypothetical protein FB451DRAFT_776323 [Mycena latifolia]|nr:hypothetical protein FB451DRAFT_776323 [Mycena latifolia]
MTLRPGTPRTVLTVRRSPAGYPPVSASLPLVPRPASVRDEACKSRSLGVVVLCRLCPRRRLQRGCRCSSALEACTLTSPAPWVALRAVHCECTNVHRCLGSTSRSSSLIESCTNAACSPPNSRTSASTHPSKISCEAAPAARRGHTPCVCALSSIKGLSWARTFQALLESEFPAARGAESNVWIRRMSEILSMPMTVLYALEHLNNNLE